MNRISSKKLLNTKWTAIHPVKKEKHFIVVEIVRPEGFEDPQVPFEFIKIEAVFSKSVYQIEWIELKDAQKWRQGWV